MGCPTHDPTHWSSQCVREMYPVFSSVTDQRCFCRDILFCAPRLNKTASAAATALATTATTTTTTTTTSNVKGNETSTAAAVFTSRFTSLPEGCTDLTNVARMRRSLSNDVLLQPASRRHVWSLVLHGCSSAGGVGTSGGGGETGGGESSLAFNVTEAAHILEMKQLRWLHLDGGSTHAASHASPPKWNVSGAIGRLTHLMFLELSGIAVMSMPPKKLQNLRKLLSLGIRASPAVRGESPSHAIQRWARVLDSVRGVKSLHTLMLDSNHIHTAAMPPDLFTELKLIRVVNLAGNTLTSLPPSLIAHKGVEVLNIADNDLAWDRVPVTGTLWRGRESTAEGGSGESGGGEGGDGSRSWLS